MRKAFAAVFWAGLFVLMLSALVVTPHQEAPPKPEPPFPMHVAFAAAAQRVLPSVPETMAKPCEHEEYSVKAEIGAGDALLPQHRDANGRVIRGGRYENSVYQVFRPETAGG